MTRRQLLTAGTATLLLLFLRDLGRAQTQDASLQDIRASIAQAIGADASAVEVAIKAKVFTVSRVNANLLDHGTRNSEASRIDPVVSFALSGRSEFKSIHTIRVQYLARSKPSGATKIVDTIDFRRAVGGGFVFHAT
jgi:hypothetical protein